jgi:hypothetical protein
MPRSFDLCRVLGSKKLLQTAFHQDAAAARAVDRWTAPLLVVLAADLIPVSLLKPSRRDLRVPHRAVPPLFAYQQCLNCTPQFR